MRVLLIAPDDPTINAVPEIRTISSKHQCTVLNGPVLPQTIDQYVRSGYNAIHFAGHSTPQFVQLSNGTRLEAADIVRVAHAARARLLVFNSCEAAELGGYAVEHGINYAIASTRPLQDADAWQFPSAFYGALANGAWRDILAAYREASSTNGEYILLPAPAMVADYCDQIDELHAKIRGNIPVNVRLAYMMLVVTLLSLLLLLLHVVWG